MGRWIAIATRRTTERFPSRSAVYWWTNEPTDSSACLGDPRLMLNLAGYLATLSHGSLSNHHLCTPTGAFVQSYRFMAVHYSSRGISFSRSNQNNARAPKAPCIGHHILVSSSLFSFSSHSVSSDLPCTDGAQLHHSHRRTYLRERLAQVSSPIR